MKKLKSKKGFTLLEMLACIVTLLLLSGICTMGTDLAVDSYNRSMFETDSQTLQNTLDMYLGDILRHSTLELEEGMFVSATKRDIKSITNMSYGMYQGKIAVKDGRFYIYKTPADQEGVLLLSEKIYTKTLKIKDFSLEYNETGQYVTGSYTIESTILEDKSVECDFTYRIATMY